jgi:hypothetical protein
VGKLRYLIRRRLVEAVNLEVLARWLWEAYTKGVRGPEEPYRGRQWQDLSFKEQARWRNVADAALGALRRERYGEPSLR